jgi:hypothetical protein
MEPSKHLTPGASETNEAFTVTFEGRNAPQGRNATPNATPPANGVMSLLSKKEEEKKPCF